MSVSYVQTANEIVAGAFRICGVLAVNQPLSLDNFNDGLAALNALLNAMMEEDPGTWRMTWGTQTFTASSAVSNGGSYYRCIRGHTAAASNEPGVGADWTSYWYEDATVSGSAVAWALSTVYTCSGDFTFTAAYSVAKAFVRYQNTDYPVKLAEFGEFLDTAVLQTTQAFYPTVANRTDEDIPRVMYFDRQNSSRLFLTPLPSSEVVSNGVLHLLYVNHIAEVAAVGDNVAIPPAWVRAMKYLLASDIADEKGVSSERSARIQAKAEALWARCRRGPHTNNSEVKGIKPCF